MRIALLGLLLACRTSPPAAAPPPLPAPPIASQGPIASQAPAPSCVRAPAPAPPPRYRGFGSHRRETSADACGVADSNLTRAEAAILALSPPAAAAAPPAWDHRTPLDRLPLIARRFGLDAGERRHLERDGMVGLARLAQPSYAWAYHEIYQSQLPVYVSLDSIFNAVYAVHDGLLEQIEREELQPRVAALLAALDCQLAVAAPTLPADTARDLDLYLAVARGLLGEKVTSVLGDPAVDREAAALIARAVASRESVTISLFGRDRVVDFTQYQPRGHYTAELAPYFRAVMWLSRLDFNLVSRSSQTAAPRLDPRETPREDLDALALAQLALGSGMTGTLERIERVLSLFAGRREDVPVTEIARLAHRAGISDLRAEDAAAKLRAAIGDGYRRTARIGPMPEGATELPAVATLLGPRIVPDTAALRPLLHGETPERQAIHGGDLAYVLGDDRGLAYLASDLARFPSLRGNLDRARRILGDAPRTGDLYAAWLDAIRALAHPAEGVTPSFMRGEAFADVRMNTALAAYAQLRHNHVLIAGQPYGEGGCEIPDGYVEPAPEVYDALARYAEIGARVIGDLSPDAATHAYFVRLGTIMRVLSAIARIELAGQPLPTAAQQFLGMVTEIGPYGSDGRPTYTGWYFDLFLDRDDAIGRPELVADYATSSAGVGHLGVDAPVLAIFAVDTGGAPRAMVGPVARAYETWSATRLDDRAARQLPAGAKQAPWTARFLTAAPPRPAFTITVDWQDEHRVLVIEAPRALGAAILELLDHHRVPKRRISRTLPAGTTRVRIDDDFELLHLQLGRWHGWGELHCMDGCRFNGFDEPPPEPADDGGN